MTASEPKTSYNEEKTRSGKILSNDESNSTMIMIEKMKLLLLDKRTNPLEFVMHVRRLLSFLERIMKSGAVAKVFFYLLERGACTAWLLQVHLEMPEATVYRVLKRLSAMGVIVKATRLHNKRLSDRGGPRPSVWTLIGSKEEDIARVVREHYRALSPKYRFAEEVAQTIMTEYIVKRNVDEISYKDIRIVVQEVPTLFKRSDVVELAAQILHGKGIKVWR